MSIKKTLYYKYLYITYLIINCLLLLVIFPKIYTAYHNYIFTININIYKIIVAICICYFEFKYIFKNEKSSYLSNRIMSLLIVLIFLPGLLFLSFIESNDLYFIVYILYLFLLQILNFVIPHANGFFSYLINVKVKYKYYDLLVYISQIFIISLSLWLNGFSLNFSFFDLSNVLELRYAFRTREVHWLLLYPLTALAYCIPLLFAISYQKKKYFQLLLLILGEMTFYSIAANRIHIFLLFISVCVCFLKEKNISSRLLMIFCILSGIIYFITQSDILIMVFRRLSYTPNIIMTYYFDFFTKNTPDHLKLFYSRYYSAFGIRSIYQLPIPSLLGSIYESGPQVNLNTGLIGGALGDFGIMGIILGPLGNILGLRLFESVVGNNANQYIMSIITCVIVFYLSNAQQFFSAFFTPSILLFFYILLIFIPMQSIS